jgi:hypothetical protein
MSLLWQIVLLYLRLVVQAQLGRALVDDIERTDHSRNQEPEWAGEDSPLDRIGPHVHDLQLSEPIETDIERLTILMSMKMIAPKAAEMAGAIPSPAKIAPRPWPSFHPHCTLLAPTAATPTPAIEETSE